MPNTNKGLKLLKNVQYRKLGEKISSLKNTSQKIAKLQIELQEACLNITSNFDESLKVVEANLSQEINKIKTEIPAKAGKTWAGAVSSIPAVNEVVTVHQVKKALIEVSQHDKEMELRSRGIVVYRAPESMKASREERKDDDLSLMKELLYQISCEDAEIISTDRLGKFDEDRENQGKHRPIKVRFKASTDRDRVLKSLSRLRDAEPRLKRLSIRQDLNDSQRAELKVKLAEAYAKSQDSEFTIYRVRGSPGDYFLKAFPKLGTNRTEDTDPTVSSDA